MILDKNSEALTVSKLAGGKGENLYKLSRESFPVPQWIVVSHLFFSEFIQENSLKEKIDEIINQDSSLKQKSEYISNIITQSPLSPNLKDSIWDAVKNLDADLFAVRSSAIGEDSSNQSFAGQLSSYLYIPKSIEIAEFVKQCWASGYSERSLSYRIHNNLDLYNIKVSVVIQEMINPDLSGVAFSINPVNGDSTQIVINSIEGVGEALVSGLVDADTYVISKSDQEIIEKTITTQEFKMTLNDQSNGMTRVELNHSNEIISHEQLKSLSEIVSKIEKYYNFPQDIEWAIKDDKIYILQARPVTTDFKNSNGHLFIWDNSNIVESYGGLTKPLTFTFARYVYHQVYVQFCQILLVPHKEILEMDYFLRNMLGIFKGRVFYNILNWYKLTSILPGFKYNRGFMETMMGTHHELKDEIADRIQPPASQEKFSAKVKRFITGCKFMYYHFFIQSVVDNFLKHFYERYDHYKNINYQSLNAHEILEKYRELENYFLRNWKAPIINDYLCMIHFGIFKLLCGKWLSKLDPSIQNDLLCGDGSLESAAPTKTIIAMAEEVKQNSQLHQLISSHDNSILMEALRQSKFTNFYNKVKDYIEKFGFRCMSEMKLEQIDLSMDPTLFFVFLKNNLNSSITLESMEEREQKIRKQAESKAFSALPFFKKLVFKWSL